MRIIVIIALFASLGLQAQQQQRRGPIDPTEAAQLRTKQMTLALDLSDGQAQQVQQLLLQQAQQRQAAKQARKNYKEEGKLPTKEERIAFKNKALDAQITHQRAMKNILNADQFELWRKLKAKRGGRKQSDKGRRPHRRTKRRS